MTNAQNVLTKELQYFNKNKSKFIKQYLNQFVLIKGNELIGSFTTQEEAYKKGIEKFGNENFLIKQVLEKDDAISFSALFSNLKNASI